MQRFIVEWTKFISNTTKIESVGTNFLSMFDKLFSSWIENLKFMNKETDPCLPTVNCSACLSCEAKNFNLIAATLPYSLYSIKQVQNVNKYSIAMWTKNLTHVNTQLKLLISKRSNRNTHRKRKFRRIKDDTSNISILKLSFVPLDNYQLVAQLIFSFIFNLLA